MKISITLGTILVCIAMSGCATTSAPVSGNGSDGKCHGPDYNAPSCIYIF